MMSLDLLDPAWVCKINDELTFCGVLEEYFADCSKHWHKETTRIQYLKEYNDKILPNLPNVNDTPISRYTKEDYDEAINVIAGRGQSSKEGVFVPYADSTLQHFRHLIEVVVVVAADHELCNNVLWGSRFTLSETESQSNAVKEYVKLKKSLTIAEEKRLAKVIFSNPEQRGQYMGLLLMFALGLRNNEACGLNFGDFKPMKDSSQCYLAWIYKTTVRDTNEVKSSGKTKNADRVIPLPEILMEFLLERKKYVEEELEKMGNERLKIEDCPVACVENQVDIRCTASQLTAAGRELFRRVGMSGDQLAYIDKELDDPEICREIKERDPTAYLFRRNFATHLYILGLTESQIQYVLGHDIEDMYETRNEFINEERLYDIKIALEQRPIFNRVISNNFDVNLELLEYDNKMVPLHNSIAEEYQIDVKSGKLRIHLAANEPGDEISVKIKPGENTVLRKDSIYYGKKPTYDRTINILKKYHEMYKE